MKNILYVFPSNFSKYRNEPVKSNDRWRLDGSGQSVTAKVDFSHLVQVYMLPLTSDSTGPIHKAIARRQPLVQV